jgi:hypothetical protein
MNATDQATKQIEGLLALCSLVADTISECPDGIPEGRLYVTLMELGCTLSRFETIVGIMISSKRVKRRGNLLLAA